MGGNSSRGNGRGYNNSGNGRGNSAAQNGGGFLQKHWQIIVAIMLIATCFLIAKGACSNSSSGSNSKSDQSDQSDMSDKSDQSDKSDISGHSGFTDLKQVRYSDSSRGGDCIRKDYTGFTLMFNPQNHTADWVSWELLASETEGNQKRSSNFWQDTSVEGCATTADYRNSGYDRGHLCPAADQKWSAEAMNDCFVMTNITPQDHALNAGAWQTLEQKERLWAKRDSALVIVAGPVYAESDTKTIGETKVRVPSAFFKVILAPYVENPRAIGFVYPNMTSPGNMENYAMTVDEVEQLTGLDFFYNLPDDIENKVESRKSFTEWNR